MHLVSFAFAIRTKRMETDGVYTGADLHRGQAGDGSGVHVGGLRQRGQGVRGQEGRRQAEVRLLNPSRSSPRLCVCLVAVWHWLLFGVRPAERKNMLQLELHTRGLLCGVAGRATRPLVYRKGPVLFQAFSPVLCVPPSPPSGLFFCVYVNWQYFRRPPDCCLHELSTLKSHALVRAGTTRFVMRR